MIEIKKQDKAEEWLCRILFSVVILLLISGYISALQTRKQLESPLIPEGIVNTIIADARFYENSIIAGLFLLAAFWLYSFGKKKIAMVLLGLAILAQQYIPLIF
jgi:uncharacterized SAM-binding protein YcdF (DUF218 family)